MAHLVNSALRYFWQVEEEVYLVSTIEGKKLGRPLATETRKRVQEAKCKGLSQSKAAHELGLSLPTIKRNWNN